MEKIPYCLHTFGCKVNTYDSGLLQQRLKQARFLAEANDPRVHILNTCAVTAEATREAVRLVRRLKARDPFCRVVVTGCAAQVDTDKFFGADLVVANSHKGKIEDLVQGLFTGATDKRVYKSNIFLKNDLEGGGGLEDEHTRSFLKIQDGCNSFCSFCVIPFARGKSRSLPIDELVQRVRSFEGISEVVLTGVHIGDYEDKGLHFEDLIEQILLKTSIARIRLSSLEPIEISDRLLELFKDPRMCPHFHMSIQSANTKVLRDMKRKYTHHNVEDALKKIQSLLPQAFVGMDVIAGFPGETEEEFQDTHDRLADLPWTRLHVFPYSPRPGTKATRMEGQLPRELIKKRSQSLNQLSRERHLRHAINQVRGVKMALGLKSTKSLKALKNQTNRALARDYWNLELTHPIEVGVEVAVKVIGHVGFDARDGIPYLTAEPLPT